MGSLSPLFIVLMALYYIYESNGLRLVNGFSKKRTSQLLRDFRLSVSDEGAPAQDVADNEDIKDSKKGNRGLETEFPKVKLRLASSKGPIKYEDEGTQYIMCSQCKSSFLYDEELFGAKGRKVCCGVCQKEWFQSGNRVLTTDKSNYLMGMKEQKVGEIRKAIEMRNWPRFPKTDRIGVFVGNLPYNYDEKEIGEIFAEYGITNISLVRDPTGLSKGFAFVETAHESDAEKMIEEMHHFNTDEERRLTVRLATQPGQRDRDRDHSNGGKEKNKKTWQRR